MNSRYFPTEDLAGNLKVLEAIVWRDCLKKDVIVLADSVREYVNTWDVWDVAYAIWSHLHNCYEYICPPVGEEMYVSWDYFMERGGGDCDNMTIVFACLAIASGLKVRAKIIEIPNAAGQPSGQGHMFPQVWIPKRGWVTFDPARESSIPGSADHEVKGWPRAHVNWTGKRPQMEQIMRVFRTGTQMPTAGVIRTPQTHIVDRTAGLLTGLLTGGCQEDFAPMGRESRMGESQASWEARRASCFAAESEPSFWEQRAGALGVTVDSFLRGLIPGAAAPVGGVGLGVPLIIGGVVIAYLLLK